VMGTRIPKDAADSLDTRIDDEGMNGMAETAQVREALERMQALSPEVSEELDAYQQWHACYAKKLGHGYLLDRCRAQEIVSPWLFTHL
jgi:hypothetical protein